jgi:MYXO-CTERM domain-containing protein
MTSSRCAALVAVAWFAVAAAPARALVQSNGAQIPSQPGCTAGKPDGLAAIFACQCTLPNVCNIGMPCASMSSCDNGQNGTCETTLWHSFNDNTCLPTNQSGLDPAMDASLTPDSFTPTCGLTFTLLSRGTARFQNTFGWYNVTGAAPTSSDLHTMLDCNSAPGASVMLDVKSDPNYKGGAIGFFLATPEDNAHGGQCAGGDCCATVARASSGAGRFYYSERQFNPDQSAANPFIHLLVYDSKLVAQKFYFAWEDTFDTTSANFTDLVASVSGVQCSAAGTSCDTGDHGQCGRGLTACNHGVVGCQALTSPAPEVCNGLDDDCNGTVDDGATCPSGEVCWNGQCVDHCSPSQEFACLAPLSCDATTLLCSDAACAGVSCPDGKVCRGGQCVGPCDGITCPHGSECTNGACVDPCAQVSCPSGQTCVEGICLPGCEQCGGIVCTSPLACDSTSGSCTDPSCATSCGAGTYCDQGSCKDACAGAVCPPGQVCKSGGCVMGMGAPDGGATSGGTTSGGGSDDGGIVLPGRTTGNGARASDGCGCAVGGQTEAPSWMLLVLAALFVMMRARWSVRARFTASPYPLSSTARRGRKSAPKR